MLYYSQLILSIVGVTSVCILAFSVCILAFAGLLTWIDNWRLNRLRRRVRAINRGRVILNTEIVGERISQYRAWVEDNETCAMDYARAPRRNLPDWF